MIHTYSADKIVNFFIDQSTVSDLSNMKLQKLLYYSQGIYIALTGKPLFKDNIEAWESGPVIRDIYTQYKKYGNGPIYSIQDDNKELDPQVKLVLDGIINTFGKLSAFELSNLNHNETPWKITKQNQTIDLGEIKSYFEDNYISFDENGPSLDAPFLKKYPLYELDNSILVKEQEDINEILDDLIEHRQEVYKALAQ